MNNGKSISRMLGGFALAGTLCCGSALAQTSGQDEGWGAGGRYSRLYQPQTVERISGEVEKVERVAPLQGMGQGIQIQVKTGHGTQNVHLGPAWFIEHQDVQLQPKDQVTITGSRVSIHGQPALLAAQVTKGDEQLKLRDANGVPVWAGWRRHSLGAGTEPGGRMAGGMMGMGQHQEMMAEHQRMMAEMRSMDTDLNQKLQQMNQAQGDAKINAMAAVINDLVKERQMMRQRMNAMQERMNPQGREATQPPRPRSGQPTEPNSR